MRKCNKQFGDNMSRPNAQSTTERPYTAGILTDSYCARIYHKTEIWSVAHNFNQKQITMIDTVQHGVNTYFI